MFRVPKKFVNQCVRHTHTHTHTHIYLYIYKRIPTDFLHHHHHILFNLFVEQTDSSVFSPWFNFINIFCSTFFIKRYSLKKCDAFIMVKLTFWHIHEHGQKLWGSTFWKILGGGVIQIFFHRFVIITRVIKINFKIWSKIFKNIEKVPNLVKNHSNLAVFPPNFAVFPKICQEQL